MIIESHDKNQLQTWIVEREKLKEEKCVRSAEELARRWGKCLGKVGRIFGDMQRCVVGEGVDLADDDHFEGAEGEQDEINGLLRFSPRSMEVGTVQDVIGVKRSIKHRVEIVARWRDAVERCVEQWKQVERCEEQHINQLVEWWGKDWSVSYANLQLMRLSP